MWSSRTSASVALAVEFALLGAIASAIGGSAGFNGEPDACVSPLRTWARVYAGVGLVFLLALLCGLAVTCVLPPDGDAEDKDVPLHHLLPAGLCAVMLCINAVGTSFVAAVKPAETLLKVVACPHDLYEQSVLCVGLSWAMAAIILLTVMATTCSCSPDTDRCCPRWRRSQVPLTSPAAFSPAMARAQRQRGF